MLTSRKDTLYTHNQYINKINFNTITFNQILEHNRAQVTNKLDTVIHAAGPALKDFDNN